jgi:chromosome segregation ATPase
MEGLIMTYVTQDEFQLLEARIRVLESEATGEKAVTRNLFERTGRNTGDIAAARVDITTLDLKLDRLAGDMSLVKAALIDHGTMLNILVQDMRTTRNEMGEVRARLDALERRLDAIERRMDERFGEIDAKLDAILAAIRGGPPL